MAGEFFVPYEAPIWANHLRDVPTRKVQLANIPTPIHRWRLPGLPDDVEVCIKRDDMTGTTLSGNKVRTLEFLLADAVSQGCRHIITCGGVQSNHCRAVAVACAQLGLQAHLFLCGDVPDLDSVDNSGNALLYRLSGAELYFVPMKSEGVPMALIASVVKDLKPRIEKLASSIVESTGEKSYIVPVGGTNKVGIWGYMSAFQELIQQGVAERFDDIVLACGTGGTAEGLALGNYLSELDLKIHGFSICDNKEYLDSLTDEALDYFDIKSVQAEDILDVVDGYRGLRYRHSRKEEIDFSVKVAQETGIMTDPVYTGKALYGLVQELNKNPNRFKGKRILFIHTGGVFGMYDGRLGDWLKADTASRNRMCMWPEVNGPVPRQGY